MTVACSRVSSMSVRAVITSFAWTTGSDPKLGVGRSREMFTGTGTVLFKNTGTCGGSRDSHGTNIVHTAERDTPITRVRARLGRACADGASCGACGRGCAVDSTGHALYWLVWAGNRTERLKEKQRLTSCDGAQELHVIIWLLAMYRGRLRGEARER
jgi:hypothetical protein